VGIKVSYLCGKVRWHELTSSEKADEYERMVAWCMAELVRITKATHGTIWWRNYCRRRTQRTIERYQEVAKAYRGN